MQPKAAFLRLSEEKKKELIEKAKDIYLSYSYEEITARMLLSAMGINSATFYRYFESKDDLYIYIYSSICESIESKFDQSTLHSRITQFINLKCYLNNDRDKKFFNLFYSLPENIIYRIYFDNDDFRNIYRQILNTEKEEGLLKENVDIEFLSWYLLTIQYNAFIYYRRSHETYNDEDFQEFINYVLFDLVKNGYYKQ